MNDPPRSFTPIRLGGSMPSTPSLRRILLAASCVLAIALLSNGRAVVQAQAPALQVIATGLDNPRGLTFGTDGALYVVEAGRGGASSLCAPQAENPNGPLRCYGPSGAI